MSIFLIILSVTFVSLPAIFLRYLPFSRIVTVIQRKKLLIYYSLCFIIQGLVIYFIFYKMHYNIRPSTYKVIVFTNSLFYVGINIIVIKNFFFQHLLVFGLQSGYSFLIHSFVAIILSVYGQNIPIYNQFFYQSIIYIVLISVITMIIWNQIKDSVVFTSSLNQDYFWHIIWLIPVLAIYSNVIATMNQDWINTWQQFISRLLMGVAIILSWKYIKLDLESFEKMYFLKNTNEMLSIQTESIKNQIKGIDENNKKISLLKHDMRHHLLILASLVEKNDIANATTLINQINESISSTKPSVYCKNSVINSAIQIYNVQAENNNIKMIYEIDILEDIPWNSNDLAILFANAFENAIQASMQQPIERREIHLICKHIGDKLAIKIMNRFDGKILFGTSGLPITTKSNHGIGIQSMLSIAMKYDAHISSSQMDGWFTLSFLFAESSNCDKETLY